MGRPPKKASVSDSGEKQKAAGNTPMVGFRMDTALREFFDKEAAKENRSFSNLILTILREWAKAKGFKG